MTIAKDHFIDEFQRLFGAPLPLFGYPSVCYVRTNGMFQWVNVSDLKLAIRLIKERYGDEDGALPEKHRKYFLKEWEVSIPWRPMAENRMKLARMNYERWKSQEQGSEGGA